MAQDEKVMTKNEELNVIESIVEKLVEQGNFYQWRDAELDAGYFSLEELGRSYVRTFSFVERSWNDDILVKVDYQSMGWPAHVVDFQPSDDVPGWYETSWYMPRGNHGFHISFYINPKKPKMLQVRSNNGYGCRSSAIYTDFTQTKEE
ncbi:hypothetical protein N9N67_10535, partial [Bacteriovoracaceae bacterium]|nr:hypothetical protein [Bacteriovoracaceae bacterium]